MDPYVISANYTEAGRLLGLFEVRNTIEAGLIAIPILLFSFGLLPFAVTAKCVIALFLAVPPGGFALIGLQDDCLSRFLFCYLRWRKGRKILQYPGGKGL